MTYAEIKDRLRDLLAEPDKLRRQRSFRRWIWAWLFGFPFGAFIGTTFAVSNNLEDSAAMIAVLVGGGLMVWAIRRRGAKAERKRCKPLAAEFKKSFPPGTMDFDLAVKLLREAETDSKVEKDLLKALNLHIKFAESPAPTPKPQASKQADSVEKLFSQAFGKQDAFAGMPKIGSFKSVAEFEAFMKKHPTFSGSYSEGPTDGKGGVFKVVKMSSSATSKTGFTPDPGSDELLGDLKQAEAPAPAAAEAPPPTASAEPVAEAEAEPSPQFIPLDPYDVPAESADDDADQSRKSP
jgi:hypothetical protein